MKNSKQIFILVGISLLTTIQIVHSYFKITKQAFFYPDWKVYLAKQSISISNNQGFFAELLLDIGASYKFKVNKQTNTLSIELTDKTNGELPHTIRETVRFCKNCFVIDQKEKRVFTKKDASDDIVLKKKLINSGYQVVTNSVININPTKTSLGIIDPLTDHLLLFDLYQPTTLSLFEAKKELELKISLKKKLGDVYQSSQKLIFYE